MGTGRIDVPGAWHSDIVLSRPRPGVKPYSYAFDRRRCLSCDTRADEDDEDKDSECACACPCDDGTDTDTPRSANKLSASSLVVSTGTRSPSISVGTPTTPGRSWAIPFRPIAESCRRGPPVAVLAGTELGMGRVWALDAGGEGVPVCVGVTSVLSTAAGGGTRPPERNKGHKERSSGSDADAGERCERMAAACPIRVSVVEVERQDAPRATGPAGVCSIQTWTPRATAGYAPNGA